ncbi:MAG: hypothetical protein ACI8QF_000591 [Limisphaerales bacterium]
MKFQILRFGLSGGDGFQFAGVRVGVVEGPGGIAFHAHQFAGIEELVVVDLLDMLVVVVAVRDDRDPAHSMGF